MKTADMSALFGKICVAAYSTVFSLILYKEFLLMQGVNPALCLGLAPRDPVPLPLPCIEDAT